MSLIVPPRNEAELLSLYQHTVETLMASNVVKNKQLTYSLKISYSAELGGGISLAQPNDEDLKAFFLPFRCLYMDSEVLYFPKMANIVTRLLVDKEEIDKVRHAKKIFASSLNQGVFDLSYNDRKFTPKEIIDLWFYSYYFHIDLDKRRLMEEIRGEIGEPIFRMALLHPVIELMRCYRWLSRVISLKFDVTP